MVRLPRYVWLLAIIVCWPTLLFAGPLFQMSGEGIRVTLYDDPCKVEGVSNLPFRATWEEGGKTFDGCWSPSFDRERVNAFFTDKSVVSFPPAMFKRLVGA